MESHQPCPITGRWPCPEHTVCPTDNIYIVKPSIIIGDSYGTMTMSIFSDRRSAGDRRAADRRNRK